MSCTNSATLPLSSSVYYSVYEQYVNYYWNTDTCYNSESFSAYINNKCLAESPSNSMIYTYPIVTEYYSSGDCSSYSYTYDPLLRENTRYFEGFSCIECTIEDAIFKGDDGFLFATT